MTAKEKSVKTFTPRDWIKLIFLYLFIPTILLICGGDTGWWQAWVYALLVFVCGVGSHLWAEKRHPGILAERKNIDEGKNIKAWDRALAPLMAVSISFPLMIVAGLDHRFGWSASFPIWLNLGGLIIVALGYGLGAWALAENRFFSGVVRIQEDRGHVVCESGPYKIVRHPGYAGNVLPLAGIVLALNSVWTVIPAGVALVISVARTWLEDKTLQEELPGYKEYAQRVRYRLIPGIF